MCKKTTKNNNKRFVHFHDIFNTNYSCLLLVADVASTAISAFSDTVILRLIMRPKVQKYQYKNELTIAEYLITRFICIGVFNKIQKS